MRIRDMPRELMRKLKIVCAMEEKTIRQKVIELITAETNSRLPEDKAPP